MATALETFHHALGTVVAGADLPDDHPIVLAVPSLFTVEATQTPAVKPVRAAKSKG